jgi:hypothetical protein
MILSKWWHYVLAGIVGYILLIGKSAQTRSLPVTYIVNSPNFVQHMMGIFAVTIIIFGVYNIIRWISSHFI